MSAVITLYKPQLSDLWFRQKMLADEDTMSYNRAWGGTVSFPREVWEEWYSRWLSGTDGRRFYRCVKNEKGDFVGEIAYRYDDELHGYVLNVIICSEYRGLGYGSEALEALINAARESGISEVYDDIAIDNPAVGMFLRRGFCEEYRTDEKIILRKTL